MSIVEVRDGHSTKGGEEGGILILVNTGINSVKQSLSGRDVT